MLLSPKHQPFPFPHPERGQILIMVVLLMVIILTIGLSLATRSLTNFRQATEEDSSQRAFSAAEAGLNVALRNNLTEVRDPNFSAQTSYTTNVKSISSKAITLQQGLPAKKNESVDVWLSKYTNAANESSYTEKWSGTITVHFGDTTMPCPEAPAFDITIISDTLTGPVSRQYAYDMCTQRTNNFSRNVDSVKKEIDGKTYEYAFTLPTITNGIIMRIIPLYNDTPLAVTTNSSDLPLPSQGKVIESVGTSGGTQRKIVVVEGNPKLPLELFPYTLFTPSNL